MPASCNAETMFLNSATCWPRVPNAEYAACGAKKPSVL